MTKLRASKEMEQVECSHITAGSEKLYSHSERAWHLIIDLNIHIAYDIANQLLVDYPRKMES
jgi:hypothetical protein